MYSLQLHNENSKLRTYGLVKCSAGLEIYLLKITNLKHRKTLTQIRHSRDRLMIETGRHKKYQPMNVFVHFVEDEIHFVIKCKTYDLIRKPLFDVCLDLKQNFEHYTDQGK